MKFDELYESIMNERYSMLGITGTDEENDAYWAGTKLGNPYGGSPGGVASKRRRSKPMKVKHPVGWQADHRGETDRAVSHRFGKPWKDAGSRPGDTSYRRPKDRFGSAGAPVGSPFNKTPPKNPLAKDSPELRESFDELCESLLGKMSKAASIDPSKVQLPSKAKMSTNVADPDALIAKTRDNIIKSAPLLKKAQGMDIPQNVKDIAKDGLKAAAQVRRDVRMPKRPQRPSRDARAQRDKALKHQDDLKRYNSTK